MKNGINVHLEIGNNFRKLTQILDEYEQECYTYKLDEEKTLMMV